MKHNCIWRGAALLLSCVILPACIAKEASATTDSSVFATEEIGEATNAVKVSTIYTWVLPRRGGGGGSPYQNNCAGGEVVVGLYGRSGSRVDQLGIICAPLKADGSLGPATTRGTAGGQGGGPFYALCSAGQALVGLNGRSGSEVDQIGIECAPVIDWMKHGVVWTSRVAGGGSGGSPFTDLCPAGYVVTSIAGRSGARVDAEQATCSYLEP